MAWNPTNADDVELIVSVVERNDAGTRTGSTTLTTTARVVVDSFTISSDEDLTGLSGVGNPEALGISQGNVEHSFDFVIQGEDAKTFKNLASDDGRANELEIIARLDDYRDKLVGARAGTRELSGSDGDPVEFSVSGIATGRDPGDNVSA